MGMKYFDWDEDKNEWLMQERGISFQMCVECIISDKLIAVVQNHPPYDHQQVYIFEYEDYCYEVPFVEDEEKIFLKTAHQSHEATKRYLKNNHD
jgi:hypothetical protein